MMQYLSFKSAFNKGNSGFANQKTLVVHAGLGKTGSSAIQHYLANNPEKLKGLGIYYKTTEKLGDYEISSGNGLELCLLLMGNHTSQQVCELLQSHLGDGEATPLISSEWFQDLSTAAWNEICEIAALLGYQVCILFFVRDVGSYLISIYDQEIKRHGVYVEFADYWKKTGWRHYESLVSISKIHPSVKVKAMSYDENIDCLLPTFFKATMGYDCMEITDFENVKTINRSLTIIEREILRKLNRIHGDKYSREFSDLLIYANPDLSNESIDLTPFVAEFQEVFSSQIEWTNNEFFEGKSVVKIIRMERMNEKTPMDELMKARHKAMVSEITIEWAFSKLESLSISGG